MAVRKECQNDIKGIQLDLDKIGLHNLKSIEKNAMSRTMLENELSAHKMNVEKNVSVSIKHVVLKVKEDVKRENAVLKALISSDLQEVKGKLFRTMEKKVVEEVDTKVKQEMVN